MIWVDVLWFQEKHPNWKTKLILWATKQPYTHVAIVGEALDGKQYICHAIQEGVVIQPAHEYVNDDRWVVRKKRVQLTCTREELQGFVRGERGKDYSETQLALITILERVRLDWLKKWLGDGDAERICSEFVAVVLKHYSYIPMPDDLDLITPAILEDIVKPEVCRE